EHIDLAAIAIKGPLAKPACRVLAGRFGVGLSQVLHCEYVVPYPPLEMNHWVQMSSIAAGWQRHARDVLLAMEPAAAYETERERKHRRRKPLDQMEWVRIGKLVEARSEPGPRSKFKIQKAREEVSKETRHEYDTVAQYHKRFLAALKGKPGLV
ncbi:MAG TPA: hypothetical protein VG322_00435, partial [Candidatus Acidoferrales bacterium]|nr:hypothetical protein [Candidatus Acidoferrales bacterium]